MEPTCPRCGHLISPSDCSDGGLTFHCSACAAVLRLRAPLPGFMPNPSETADDSSFESNEELSLADEPTLSADENPLVEVETDTPIDFESAEPDAVELPELKELGQQDELSLVDPEESVGDEFEPLRLDELDDPIGDEPAFVPDPTDVPPMFEPGSEEEVEVDAPATLEFANAAAEVAEIVDEDVGTPIESLHEEVADVLDQAEAGMAAADAAAIDGLTFLDGSDRADKDAPSPNDDLTLADDAAPSFEPQSESAPEDTGGTDADDQGFDFEDSIEQELTFDQVPGVDDVPPVAAESPAEPHVVLEPESGRSSYGHPGSFLEESSEEASSLEAELEAASIDVDPPTLESAEAVLPDFESSELEATDLGLDATDLADDANSMVEEFSEIPDPAAQLAASSDELEDFVAEAPEIVFDEVAEIEESVDLGFEDAARAEFDPEQISADDIQLEPLAAEVADLRPAGTAAESGRGKAFGMVGDATGMAIAPAVPRKRNISVDLLKLVLGAVLGLAVAQLVLWWALKLDPLGLAHRMPAALAIIVPEKLRNSLPPLVQAPDLGFNDDADEDEDEDDAMVADESVAESSEFDETNPMNEAADLEVADAVLSDVDRDSAFGGEMADGSGTTQPSGPPPPADDLAFDSEEAAADDADLFGDLEDTGDPMSEDDLGDVAEAEAVPFAGLGPKNMEATSPYDTGAALAAAKQAAGEIDTILAGGSDKGTLRAAAREFYVRCAELAEQSTLVARGGDAETVLDETRAFLGSLIADGKKLPVLGKGANSWIARDKGRGAALAGSVTSIDDLGELQEVQFKLLGTDTTITVITKGNADLMQGSQAVVLGIIVNDPSTNLIGYTGLDDKVIWSTDVFIVR